mgnify:CR=1 FL=1
MVPGTLDGEEAPAVGVPSTAAGGKSVAEREGVGGTGVEADRVQAVSRKR